MTDPGTGQPSSPPMLLHTPAPVLRLDPTYSTEDLFQSYIDFDLPIDYFEHIEYHFPTRVGELLEFVNYLDQIRNQHSYNFMTEPQMARSVLNTLTTRVEVTRPWSEAVLDRLKQVIGLRTEPSIRIKPVTDAVPPQAAEYAGTLGLVIELGQAFAARTLLTDADVSDWRNSKLYMGLPEAAKVRFSTTKPDDTSRAVTALSASSDEPHMLRSNVPYKLSKSNNSWTLQLNADGMQQVLLWSPSPLTIEGEQLRITRQEADQTYTITHYGAATTVTIRY